MAKIGLRYIVAKGTTGFIVGKSVQADITINTNDAKLPAEDTIIESDKSFKDGKFVLGVDDLTDAMQTEFLGHTIVDGEITSRVVDQSPYVEVGFCGVKRVNKINKFRAIWLKKVQFAEPNDSNKTKGETLSFETPTIEGTIMANDLGVWKEEKTFDLESDAVNYLNTKAGLPASASAGFIGILQLQEQVEH